MALTLPGTTVPLTIADLQAIVAKVKPFFPNREVIIAGGAPRDVFHGRPIKDIDIWVGGTDETLVEGGAYSVRDSLNVGASRKSDGDINVVPLKESNKAAYLSAGFKVYNIDPGFHCLPTQIIWRPTDDLRRNVVESFDLGICQVWVDSRGLRGTPAFWKDSTNHTLTKVGNDWENDEAQAAKHLARVQAKYEGWKLRDERSKTPAITGSFTCSSGKKIYFTPTGHHDVETTIPQTLPALVWQEGLVTFAGRGGGKAWF